MKNVLIIIAILAIASLGWYWYSNVESEKSMSENITAEMPEGESGTTETTAEGTSPQTENSDTLSPTGATASIKEFTVTGSNYSFSLKNISVSKGDRVRIIFKNADGFHDLKIDEFAVATQKIGAGKEETVEFMADKVGSFEYYCSVGNHRAQGMKGTLVVK